VPKKQLYNAVVRISA